MRVDILIIGQGIAGSTLAVELRKRGFSVLVVDREDEGASSRVAAGLVTPITGKGLNPAWRQDVYLPIAKEFYQSLSPDLWHDSPAVRLFADEKELMKWQSKPDFVRCWGRMLAVSDCPISSVHGGIEMGDAAWLDTRRFISVVKEELLEDGAWVAEGFSQQDASLANGVVRWRDVTADKIILCQGAYGLGKSGWFSEVNHRSAKGEILTLNLPEVSPSHRLHARGWLAPRGDGLFKAGATYDWNRLDSEPTPEGRESVMRNLATWLDVSQAEVVAHEAGVRPIVRSSKPVVGFLKEHAQVGFFNGLGSKGSLMAPAVAAHFAGVLTGEHKLDEELNLQNL
ncbi:MAG: NAD(P)/FAD-dependent oxidoreductase [Akkermansiaceae bacterium]